MRTSARAKIESAKERRFIGIIKRFSTTVRPPVKLQRASYRRRGASNWIDS